MLEKLINLGKEQLGTMLKQKESLTDQQVNETFNVAGDSFTKGLKEQTMSGNMSQMKSLFNGNKDHAPSLVQNVTKHFVPQLSSRLGISEPQAGSISNMIVPFLVDKFSGKETGTANDDKSLLSQFGLGEEGILTGMKDKLGGMFGK